MHGSGPTSEAVRTLHASSGRRSLSAVAAIFGLTSILIALDLAGRGFSAA